MRQYAENIAAMIAAIAASYLAISFIMARFDWLRPFEWAPFDRAILLVGCGLVAVFGWLALELRRHSPFR